MKLFLIVRSVASAAISETATIVDTVVALRRWEGVVREVDARLDEPCTCDQPGACVNPRHL